MNEKIIEVCNLNFENVLTNISLEIFKGDFIAILGPNGGGKTTFVKLLLNILKQNAGEIKFYEDLKYEGILSTSSHYRILNILELHFNKK